MTTQLPREAARESIAMTVEEYLFSLGGRGLAKTTRLSHRAHLAPLIEWARLSGITSLVQIDVRALEAYVGWLFDRRNSEGNAYSWSTQAHRLGALRLLFAWALRTERVQVNPASALPRPRYPRRLPRAILNAREAERVLDVPRVETWRGLRDRAMLEVLYSTGIRRAELTNLDLADVDLQRGTLLVREGKGGKDRVVPLGARALGWVQRYIREGREQSVRQPTCLALFLNDRGRRIRPTRLTDRLRRYMVASGVDKPGSCHIWRHTMATLMHDAGADIRDLQEILGHADLATTEIYTHVSISRLKAVHARTHPAERQARLERKRRKVMVEDEPAEG